MTMYFNKPRAGWTPHICRHAVIVMLLSRAALAQANGGAFPLPAVPLGPDDLVSVTVYGVSDLSRTLRISRDGLLQMPMVEQPIVASGKLPSALEADIAAALRRSELVLNPVVTVTVTEYVSRQVTIAGAVHNPTTIQAIANIRLLEAIARAGGLTEDAGAEIIFRSKAESGSSIVRSISVKQLMEHPDDTSNPVLLPGDEISVPRAPRVFVIGNVRRQGAIALTDSSVTTVIKALSLAEGLAPYAGNEAWILRPLPDSADKEQIPVPLAEIMNRKKPDMELRAEDIFYVPDNTTKRLSADILNRIASFGSATASGLLIWK
jgi:polysaccharide export outer membrane protein